LQVETTICNEIRGHGNIVVINDAQTDQAFCRHPTPEMYGFRSYISAPIMLDGTVWGTLCAIDPQPRELDRPEIVNTFRLFGELIAAQLELQEHFEQTQANLRASERARFSIEESLKLTQANLSDERKTAELREQFIGILGHDLRNPLASIDAGMRLLLKNPGTERAPAIISMVQKSVLRMSGLVDNIMDFAKGRLGGGLTINRDAKQPLPPVLWQIISELASAWPDTAIEADISIDEPVDCDRGKIGQMFSNLLGNAVTHGDQRKPVRVSAKAVDGMLELTVTNYGAPISDNAMERLFEPFARGDRPSQQGLGLGLYIASQIAQAHGGTLKALSNSDETKFTFEMPLSPR
jgi:signal transduction histidine kinase